MAFLESIYNKVPIDVQWMHMDAVRNKEGKPSQHICGCGRFHTMYEFNSAVVIRCYGQWYRLTMRFEPCLP